MRTDDGLADRLPLLDSRLVDRLLAGDPPPAIAAERPTIERLSELRRRGLERDGPFLVSR